MLQTRVSLNWDNKGKDKFMGTFRNFWGFFIFCIEMDERQSFMGTLKHFFDE